MFYDSLDLEDPIMSPISFQESQIPTQLSPSSSLSTPVIPRNDWNEDMLPVRVTLDPEAHLEIKSSLHAQEVSANPLSKGSVDGGCCCHTLDISS